MTADSHQTTLGAYTALPELHDLMGRFASDRERTADY